MEKTLDTEIFDCYGTTERSIGLYAENGHYYEPPLYSIDEYKPESILTTGLINSGFPLIRYQVSDVVEHNNVYNPSKKSLEIDNILGRVDDYIQLEDGSKIGRMSMTIFNVDGIKNAQFIQDSVKAVKLNIVSSGQVDEVKLLKNLRKRLGEKNSIKIKEISEEELIYTKWIYKLV